MSIEIIGVISIISVEALALRRQVILSRGINNIVLTRQWFNVLKILCKHDLT